MKETENKKFTIVAAILFLLGVLFLAWKAPMGYAAKDECFYLALAKRLAGGDALLLNEWFISQPFGILLVPLMKLVSLVKKDSEGIILLFRYLYVALHSFAALYMFWRLRGKYGNKCVPGILLFLVYTPFNMMNFNYNGMGITFVLLSGATLLSLPDAGKGKNFFLCLAGFFFAAAVICCPYLLAVYLLYTIGYFAWIIKKKEGKKSAGNWLFFTLGAAILAFATLLSIVSHRGFSVALLKDCLSRILSNPTHGGAGIWEVKVYFETLFGSRSVLIATALLIACLVFTTIAVKKYAGTVSLLLAVVYSALFYVSNDGYVNFCVLPLAIPGLAAFFALKKKDWKTFWFMYVPGVLYSFCISLSTNQKSHNIYSVMVIASVAGSLFILQYLAECLQAEKKKAEKRLVFICSLLSILVALGTTITFRAKDAFWEPLGVASLQEKIAEGPEKGLKTTAITKTSLEMVLADAAVMREMQGEKVCYMDVEYGAYLMLADGRENASYATYYEGEESYRREMLAFYYAYFPEKTADLIWIQGEDDYENWLTTLSRTDYDTEKTGLGNHIIFKR